MRFLSLPGLMCLALISFSSQANAKGLGVVGESDDIKFLYDIEDPEGAVEDVYLGYMTKSYFLIAGVYMKDAGYVIGIKGVDDSYIEMPEGVELKALQSEGLIPDPLPEYKIPLMDYLIGFSLWLILPLIFLWVKLFGNKEPEDNEIEPVNLETKPVSLDKRE